MAPGVVDTDMQKQIRESTAEDFPMVEQFREMKRDESFSTIGQVASGLLDLAFGEPHDDVLVDLRT